MTDKYKYLKHLQPNMTIHKHREVSLEIYLQEQLLCLNLLELLSAPSPRCRAPTPGVKMTSVLTKNPPADANAALRRPLPPPDKTHFPFSSHSLSQSLQPYSLKKNVISATITKRWM